MKNLLTKIMAILLTVAFMSALSASAQKSSPHDYTPPTISHYKALCGEGGNGMLMVLTAPATTTTYTADITVYGSGSAYLNNLTHNRSASVTFNCPGGCIRTVSLTVTAPIGTNEVALTYNAASCSTEPNGIMVEYQRLRVTP